MSSRYVSLHNHTDYSYQDSIAKIPELVGRAAELGYPALSITDHGHIMGAIDFYQECQKKKIKPILGVEAYITESAKAKERGAKHIVLLAENNTGWENIIRLMSFANTPIDQGGGFYYSPRIDVEKLFELNEGIIVLTACMHGLIPYWMCHDVDKAERLTLQFKEVFGDRFYLEIQNVNRGPYTYIPEQDEIMEVSRNFSKQFGIPVVATNDVHYVLKEDKFSHEIWKAISSKKTILDPVITDKNKFGRIKFKGEDYYVQTYENMLHGFHHEEIVASLDIAKRCNVTIDFDATAHMPRYRSDMNDDEVYELLLQRCREETVRRKLFTKKDTIYVDRIKKELADIKEANLQHYFMIVHDVIKDSDSHGIPRGYSRGSAGGSLVSYVLDITRIDPIKYNLFWERFYNKGRKGSMPDIDLDFCVLRRERVVEYLKKTFGETKIFPMSTVSTLAGKAALKDTGKGIGMQFNHVNKITASFPHKCNTIKEAIEHSSEIKEMSEGRDSDIEAWEIALKTEQDKEKREKLDSDIRDRKRMLKMLFKHALRLEGCKRQRSSHACAILVSDKPIDGKVPVSYDASHKRQLTGWDMYTLEKLGFLKLDVLGVKSVTVVDIIQDILRKRRVIYDEDAPERFDDERVFQMVARGYTKGIFQIESYLGQSWCQKVKPKTLGDWSDIIAMVRPAVLDTGMADTYVTNKNSGRIEYVHDDLAQVLENTYGILLYQEQAIEMVKQLAGYSLSEADNLRKAIGKKLPEVMAQHKGKFADGMKEHGYSEEETEKLWILLEAGAGYSFNKCVSGDTMIERGTSGPHGGSHTIAHLYRVMNDKEYAKNTGSIALRKKIRRNGYGKCLALDGDGRIRPRPIKDIIYSGYKRVCLLRLSNGKTIKATPEHKFFSTEGFVPVKEFKIGITKLVVDGGYEPTDFSKSAKYSDKNNSHKHRPYAEPTKGFPCGENNPAYTNGRFTEFQTSKITLQDINYCQRCGAVDVPLEHHHVDGNRNNSSIENIEKLCNSCHKKTDYEIGKRKKRWAKGHKTDLVTVLDIQRYAGWEDTYDIEMDTAEHNWLANGIVTSNSHSVGYAMLGYVMAWFKKHHPIEFFTAMLQMSVQEQKPHAEVAELYYDAKNYGIEIKPPDIKKANFDFGIFDNKIYYGMGHIKGIGKSTKKKIQLLQPADKPADLRHIINTHNIGRSLLETLIMAGAFDRIVRSYYKSRLHMANEFAAFFMLTPKRRQAVEMIMQEKPEISFIEAARLWLGIMADKVKNEKIKALFAYEPTVDIERTAEAEEELLGVSMTCCKTHAYRGSSKVVSVGDLQRHARFRTEYEVLACPRDIRVIEKSDKVFAMLTIYDNDGVMQSAMFSEAFQEYYCTLKDASVVLLTGQVSKYGSFVINKCEIPEKL